jgi:hypothetical protein
MQVTRMFGGGSVWSCSGQLIRQLTDQMVCQLTDKIATTSNSFTTENFGGHNPSAFDVMVNQYHFFRPSPETRGITHFH